MTSACTLSLQQRGGIAVANRNVVNSPSAHRLHKLPARRSSAAVCHAFGSRAKFQQTLHHTPKKNSFRCRVADTAFGHKLISKAEVPAFIMRDDLIDQLYRWISIETGEDCVKNFGLPMSVDTIMKNFDGEEILWGFKIGVFKEGVKVGELAVRFDDENASKYEWLDRGSDGMPVSGGKAQLVPGKNLEIWKVDDKPVDEDLRSALKAVCTSLMGALNKYYSFGSVFAEDI